jgi:hypothetical protein
VVKRLPPIPWEKLAPWHRDSWQGEEAANALLLDDLAVNTCVRNIIATMWGIWKDHHFFRSEYQFKEDFTSDVISMVLMRVISKSGLVFETGSNPDGSGWLNRVVKNCCKDVRRTAVRETEKNLRLEEPPTAQEHQKVSASATSHTAQTAEGRGTLAQRDAWFETATRVLEDPQAYPRASKKKSLAYLAVYHASPGPIELARAAAAENGRGRGLKRSANDTRELLVHWTRNHREPCNRSLVGGINEHFGTASGGYFVPTHNHKAISELVWIFNSATQKSLSQWRKHAPDDKLEGHENLLRLLRHAKKDIEK